MENDQKFINESYIKKVLTSLYEWMPLKRKNGGILQDSRDEDGNLTTITTNENEIALGKYNKSNEDTILSVGVGSSNEDRKNAIEIKKDGMIYIITDLKTNSATSLQNTLAQKGTTICSTYEEMLSYVDFKNLGRLLYLTDSSEYNGVQYVAGLYVISTSSSGGVVILSRLGTTSSSSIDISERVDGIEIRVDKLEEKVVNIENWKDSEVWKDESITEQELEDITGMDL